ncbi:class I SAM-dependent methyltransferase [Candidatus Protofrankia californiensis]|uniref:class I SAM-dependent methyltransferase n=1 Tax=Candidatus Protofrankia californiensis TaxID=1839754 RepID=UPI001F49E672|nr:class I SAM-dependent methyltransferase [Candidatus Protofrankia californiensis]
MSTYVLDQGHPGERTRLEAMAGAWDPGTMRLVGALGIGTGHRCLEVGAGTGSIARALADVVGPEGHVLAVDRDIRFLGELPDGVEVRCMDVMVDDLPHAQFDLVHTRLLIAHLHPHRRALQRLAAAVTPGGWLLVEEVDWTCADLIVPEAPIHIAMVRALQQLMGERGGFDATYGRRLLGDVLSLGFTDVSAQYRGTQSRSSSESWLAWQLLVEQFQQGIIQAELMTQQEVDEWWSLSRDENNLVVGVTMFAVQARRLLEVSLGL